MFRRFSKILPALFVIVGSTLLKSPVAPAGRVAGTTASPIAHVVILIQENHSFDNVLGLLCLHQNGKFQRKMVRQSSRAPRERPV